MDISVLGVDLGKNVCSVVGLDPSGADCDASQGEAGDADCSGGEVLSVHCRDGGLLRAHHLGRVVPLTAMMSG
jgi:hypothetical protein